jgi:glycolate oxidase
MKPIDPARFQTLQEIVATARARLAPGPWAYLAGATETETTQLRNRQALDSLAFRPRVLNDVSQVSARANFMGREMRLPVLLAPVGGLELYVRGDAAWVDDYVHRARDQGFTAFCFTVDSALYSRRERDLLGRFTKPWRPTDNAGLLKQAALNWDDVKRYKDKHTLPLILKGSPLPKMQTKRYNKAQQWCTSRIMVVDSWITAWAALRYYPKWLLPLPVEHKSGLMVALCVAPMW